MSDTERGVQKVPEQLSTPTDLPTEVVAKITEAVNPLVADAFALYVKTKNFHWHLSGARFRDIHLLLDEQADAIFETIDPDTNGGQQAHRKEAARRPRNMR